MNTNHFIFLPGRRSTVVRRVFALLSILLLISAAPAGFAHGTDASPSGQEAQDLVQRLEALNAQLQQGATQAAGGLQGAAAERQQLLAELIEGNPGEVLRLAVTGEVRTGMPADVQGLIEERQKLEGTLQVLHVDYKDHSQSHYVYLLETDAGEHFSLHFAKQPPGLLSGARVRTNGLLLRGAKARDAGDTEGAVAVADEEADIELLEAPGSKNSTSGSGTTTSTTQNTLGAQKTLVILVNFQDTIQPYTLSDVQSMIFGTTSNFFLENSFQQTWLSGDVAGSYTIPLDSTACNSASVQNYADSAATAAGINLSAYAHHVYVFPYSAACGWSGLSTVGGSPSTSWINGSLRLGVTAHELGHALGLFHAHSLDCGTATLGSTCTTAEYGDTLDMMGTSGSQFNAVQKERLGWLNAGASPPITTVLADGTYTVEAYESTGSGPKALKLLKSVDPSTGKRTWYYVESRQAIGIDSWLASNANVMNGVVIHSGTESSGNSSFLLDMTPASGSTSYEDWKDPALVAGQSFSDPNAGVTLTTEWVNATEAAITVQFVDTVAVSTDQSTYSRGQTVSIATTVRQGASPVANVAVSFTVNKANGAVVTGSATTGSNGIAVYKLRLGKQDPVGTYQAAVAALSRSAATSFTVQ